METKDIIRLVRERAASYGAVRATALTAIALDAAADRLAVLHAAAARQPAAHARPAKAPIIVWSPDSTTPPKIVHPTHGSAHHAAHKLAGQHRGQTFYVMERSGRAICHEVDEQ